MNQVLEGRLSGNFGKLLEAKCEVQKKRLTSGQPHHLRWHSHEEL